MVLQTRSTKRLLVVILCFLACGILGFFWDSGKGYRIIASQYGPPKAGAYNVIPQGKLVAVSNVIIAETKEHLLQGPQNKTLSHGAERTKENGKSKKRNPAPVFRKTGVYKVSGIDIYFSSAFLDERFPDDKAVRVFGVQHKRVNSTLYCRFAGVQYIKAEMEFIFPKWPPNNAYLAVAYYCPYTKLLDKKTVEMTTELSKPGVAIPLHLVNSAVRSENMSICVKAGTGPLDPHKLVEWIEIYRLLGIDSFIIYNADIRGRAWDVLKYYEQQGIVTTVAFPLLKKVIKDFQSKRPLTNGEYYAMEQQSMVISINDCLYQASQYYTYVLSVDLDEVLVPQRQETLLSMVQRADRNQPLASGYIFKTGWYFKDFKTEKEKVFFTPFHMFYTLHRTPVGNNQPKAVIKTSAFRTVNWHAVVAALQASGRELNYMLDYKTYGYIHHFRSFCIDKYEKEQCNTLVKKYEEDNIIKFYLYKLLPRTSLVFHKLNLYL